MNGLPSSPRIEPNQTWASLILALRMPAPERREQLLEVQLLAAVGDVDDLVGVPGFQPVGQRGQVGGGVIEAAVALLDDERIGSPLAFLVDEERVVLGRHGAVEEDGAGASALAARSRSHQFVHDGLQARVVEALAQGVVELHAQPAIDGVELGLGSAIISRQIARFSASPAWSFTSSARARSRVAWLKPGFSGRTGR